MKAALALLLALTCSTVSAADKATIGAWNIEFLGKPDKRGGSAHGIAQSATDVANYIKDGEVELLSVAEICDDEQDNKLDNSTLDKVVEKLSDSSHEWTYQLCRKKHENDVSQCVGFLWDKKHVTKQGSTFDIDIPEDSEGFNLWDRGMHAAKFSFGEGKTDIVVIPVHMKANRGMPVYKARRQRAKEAKALVDALPDVRDHFSDKDVVIMGDTNILHYDESAAKTFRDAGFYDLNDGDNPTTYHGAAPFDRIFVTNTQPELKFADMSIMEADDPFEHKKKLSDHYMVETEITVMEDDD